MDTPKKREPILIITSPYKTGSGKLWKTCKEEMELLAKTGRKILIYDIDNNGELLCETLKNDKLKKQ